MPLTGSSSLWTTPPSVTEKPLQPEPWPGRGGQARTTRSQPCRAARAPMLRPLARRPPRHWDRSVSSRGPRGSAVPTGMLGNTPAPVPFESSVSHRTHATGPSQPPAPPSGPAQARPSPGEPLRVARLQMLPKSSRGPRQAFVRAPRGCPPPLAPTVHGPQGHAEPAPRAGLALT